MKTFGIIFIIVLAVVTMGYFLFQSSEKESDPGSKPGELLDNQGATHIPEGSKSQASYNSNPPTSGDHWPAPANWGVYKAEQPDERLIHNLEHGGIWISYKPDTAAETVAKLEDFAQRYRKVIVAPRAANDSNMALAAWTRLQKLESFDENAILEFIQAHYDQGPEKVP